MSVREEDRQKNTCPSRGLGVAAVAIGVGVGAALYYFFSKRGENPHGEGSTSNWACNQEQALPQEDTFINNTTMSDSTDSNINDTGVSSQTDSMTDSSTNDGPSDTCDSYSNNDSVTSIVTDSDIEVISDEDVFTSQTDYTGTSGLDDSLTDFEEVSYYGNGNSTTISDSDINESDMTNSSIDRPTGYWFFDLVHLLTGDNISPRVIRRRRREDEETQMDRVKALSEQEYVLSMRQQQFRERSWSLEECSICFDVILKDQKVTTLPCTHHFHSECIQPWLTEQQTCPNCRKQAQ